MALVFYNFFQEDDSFSSDPSDTPKQSASAKEASDIIANNRDETKTNTTINIQPKSATEIMQQNSGSAANSSKTYGAQSQGAGQRISSLTNQYINKPTVTTPKQNSNPTFSSRGI